MLPADGADIVPPRQPLPGYEILRTALYEPADPESIRIAPHEAYESYLKMHKVLVGSATAYELIGIHEALRMESMPRYLNVAGWSAAEAALVSDAMPTYRRLQLIDTAVDCWERSLATQLQYNQTDKYHLVEYAAPYRSALDIAIAPLLKGIVSGDVTKKTCQSVFTDCLAIAEANEVQSRLAWQAGNSEAAAEHVGLGYECNAMLALNRLESPTWFAIPALARADTGYHHNQQTHDLLVIRQKWGEIQSVVPVEVKSAASVRDRERYQALLVRGKMHLSLDGFHRPGETLQALGAVYRGDASKRERQTVDRVSSRFMEMLHDYYTGSYLGAVATSRVLPLFRDNAQVVARHPGLGVGVLSGSQK